MNRSLRRIWTLAAKEIKVTFQGPLIYFLTAVFIFMNGWVFFNGLIISRNEQVVKVSDTILTALFGNMNFLCLIVVPLVTMKTFAEEKKQGTLSLLLGSSLTHFEIIMGKFLAVLASMIFMLSFTLIFPIIIAGTGRPDYPILFTGYLGVLLNICGFLAIGLFTSSLTENQIMAALSCFCIIFSLLLLAYSPQVVSEYLLGQILYYLGLPFHSEAFARGVVRSMDFIYYGSVVTIALLLTQESLSSRHW